MRVSILAIDGVFDTGLATVLDAFAIANELAAMTGLDSPRFDAVVTGVRRKVHTAQGLSVPVTAANDKGAPDCVVVPAIGCKMPAPLEHALARRDVRDALAVLRTWSGAGSALAAACVGTFVLAEAGLLDGKEATTTWWLWPVFRPVCP